MSKAKFNEIRDLIEERRYGEARHLLRAIDHPIAQEWLAKLDEIASAPPSPAMPIYAMFSASEAAAALKASATQATATKKKTTDKR